MSKVERARGDLAGLDALAVDAVIVPLFEERAQPQGAAGFIDWRLSGRLARLILAGRFTGKRGEVVLMSALSRIGAKRMFLVGLGPTKAWAEHDPVGKMLEMASAAGAESLALAPPVGADGAPTALDVMKRWKPAVERATVPLKVLDADGSLYALLAGAR